MTTPLPLITALARAGALDRAWTLFREGGYERASGDPAALAVKGRLLKDSALRVAQGDGRRALLGDAAAVYAAADHLSAAPYLLINAAACRALAGDREGAIAVADAVLQRIAAGPSIKETPYWLAATRAEALLIKGDLAESDAALRGAMAFDPDGYDDHASTLRQFGRLLKALGEDAGWLDKHRPPVSVHFAGHLGVAPDQTSGLRAEIDALLEANRAGFGYGALAAGSDIVIAEALLARGAELHVVLPAQVKDFEVQSVIPFGEPWVARFAACFAGATSVHVAADVGRPAYEPLATALAADMAMGAAILNAQRLESRAHQMLVIDEGEGPFGGGASTSRDGAIWSRSGRPQHIVITPRTARVAASSGKTEGQANRRLAALLAVSSGGDRDILPAPTDRQSCGATQILAFASPTDALAHARGLLARETAKGLRPCLSGHYGLILKTERGLAGTALAVLDDVASMALDGTLTVSDAFATALQLDQAGEDAQYIGDMPSSSAASGARLFTLSV